MAALRALTGGEGVDAALDCPGAAEARVAAVRSARTRRLRGGGGHGDRRDQPGLPAPRAPGPRLLDLQPRVIQDECARFPHRFRLDQAAEADRLFDTQTTGTGVFTAAGG